MVFQQATAAEAFQTPVAWHVDRLLEQMRATQALALLPFWHRCSQVLNMLEHDPLVGLQPSCAWDGAGMKISEIATAMAASVSLSMLDLPLR